MIPDLHSTQKALGRLTSPFLNTPSDAVPGVIRALTGSTQELADTVQALIVERALATAEGAQLDQFGDLLGVPRNGMTDDVYRVVLGARIVEHRSSGTPEELIAFVGGLLGADNVRLVEVPVGLYIEATVPGMTPGPVNAEIAKRAELAAAAGVPVRVVVAELDYFGFDNDPNALGFDDGSLAGIWGG